ncbi:hypothetical protein B9Z55_008378 [Caenorhabditis nigoni]|uniref:DNA-directed DNA polymerase n=1 Tax=Caenorhabditis nigoni TaxID=1611254 RepID=A0A2G5UMI6_9PELO|nr:hypothetical protein B9Z55_008374 [Caenorhabditis nigoni]PIC40734.1 hypothetical protein B9Z55_008378 [Caenorhabditis nigoni]
MSRYKKAANDIALAQNDDLIGDSFPTKEEIEFFNKHAEVVDGTDLVRTTSETLVMKPRKLIFKNLQDLPKNTTLDRNVGRLFDIFIRGMIQKAGGNLENTYFWLNLRHPGYREADGYWIMHKTYKTANGHTLINLIAKHAQSTNDAKPGIALDETMTLKMRVFKTDQKKGAGGRIPENIMKLFGIKTPNVVGETHCLPKALLLGKLWSDSNSCDDNTKRTSLKSVLKNLTRPDRTEAALSQEQLNRAKKLLVDAGLNPNEKQHDLSDLATLATGMQDYRVCVWHVPEGAPCPVILTQYNQAANGLIPIFYANGHFEFFKPTIPTVNVFFCFKCNKLVGNKHGRKCKKLCNRCGAKDCEPVKNEELCCIKCFNVFHCDKCFKGHMKSKASNSLAYCDIYEKCLDCHKIHERSSYSKKAHKCFQNHFCNICMEHTKPGHECVHATPTEANSKRQLKKQEAWTMVIYDIESIVTSSSDLSNAKLVKHIPNVLCFKLICAECMGGDCLHCGPMQTMTYKQESGTVVERFVKFLKKDPRLRNAYIIAHNGGRYDHVFTLEELIKNEHCQPQFLMVGQTFISADVKIEKNNELHFRDSVKYIPMKLDQLPKAFNLKTEAKGYFPYLFNHPDNYGKTLPNLPSIKYYEPNFMSAKGHSDFEVWYEENKYMPFNFDEEIVKYCQNDVQILVEAVVKYITLCQEKMAGWNPFIQASTLASYVMHVMKHEHMKDGVLGYIPENGYGGRNNSRFALKYLLWLESKGLKLQHKLRAEGEFYAECGDGKGYHVDGYNPETREIHEVHGCLWHGCEKCYKDREALCPRNKNAKMCELYARTLDRDAALRAAGFTLHVKWECELKEEMKKNPEMRQFFKNCNHAYHLRPREAMYGGRTQQFQSLAKACSEKSIEYFDFCSLYPYINIRGTSYPKGIPQRITSDYHEITNSGPLPYRGLIFCDVLPPAECPLPVLPIRRDGKLLFVLCRTCGQWKKDEKCPHVNASERALTGVWCTDELNLAIQQGYKILKYHEVWHWPDEQWFRGGFFESFMTPLLKMKHEASGWPRENMSTIEKDEHVAAILQNDGVRMDEHNISKNPALRSLAKLFLNSTWGKFAQNPCKTETRIFRLYDVVEAIIYMTTPGFKPCCFEEWGDAHILISRRPTKDCVQTSRFTNIVYGALTTSAARIKLYNAMKTVGAENILYCDTDSIIFKQKRGVDVLGSLRGEYLGQLTNETPNGWNIEEFVALAPKVYSIKMTDKEKNEQYNTKAKGITLNSETTTKVNFNSMKKMVQNVVASFDAGFPIQLGELSTAHSKFCTYEPEMFPGLVYRMVKPKASLLVFLSGKVVITGAKTKKEIDVVFEEMLPILREFKKYI